MLAAVSDPNIALIILIAGLLLIYAECVLPGAVIPGVTGGLAVAIALAAFTSMPLTLPGLALIVSAALLLVLEAVYPVRGAAALAGVAIMAIGWTLLAGGPRRIRPSIALGVTIPFAISTVLLLSIAVRARRNKTVQASAALVGKFGEARTALSPAGKVLLDGELWDASASTAVPAGAKVRILAIQGLTLTVDRPTE